MGAPANLQRCGLLLQLAFDDGCPQAFVQGQRSRPLGLDALGLHMVAIQRQQHAYGVVVGSTQHKRRTALCQCHQQVVGVGQAVGVGK